MTVGEFCKYLNSDDLIIVTKPDGGFASGFVADMGEYYNEEILHIGADKYPCAMGGKNKHIGYEVLVL